MIALTWIFAALAGTLPADDATIKVDAAKVLNRVSPLLYGSCIEDVNHEIYGGLCAQMIFGESFEEPPQALGPKGWTSYGGMWSLAWDRLRVDPAFGAKLVRDEGIVGDGTVSTTVVFADDLGGNAGLIVRVNEPRPGPDAWIGYEVSLSIKDQNVMLGRHRNNFTMLKAAPARIEVRHDHVLRVEMKGPTIRVFLDKGAEPVLTFDDGPNALPPGRVGLRTWGSRALFGEVSSVNAAGEARGGRFEARSEAGPERDLSGAWDVIRDRGTEGRFSWDADRPFNSSRSQKIDRLQGTGRLGIANRGLNRWGIAVRKGHTYSGRAYLRQEEFTHVVAFELQSGDGSRVYARQEAKGLAGDWLPRDFQLTSDADDPKARFAVMIEGKGKVWVDQVTLMPSGDDLFHGLPFRGDIGKALQEQGLTLLRYGGSMINAPAYRWKTMVGDRGKRPQYKGWWYPQSTNGFGIEEFVQFCRAAGFEAVVSINIEETPEDAADLIEYLNGPASSAWGKKRAENGHPEPYGLKYLEVGNEEATNAHYVERFHLLYEAMKPKDKNVQYIIGAWWEPDNPISKRIVQELGREGGPVGRPRRRRRPSRGGEGGCVVHADEEAVRGVVPRDGPEGVHPRRERRPSRPGPGVGARERRERLAAARGFRPDRLPGELPPALEAERQRLGPGAALLHPLASLGHAPVSRPEDGVVGPSALAGRLGGQHAGPGRDGHPRRGGAPADPEGRERGRLSATGGDRPRSCRDARARGEGEHLDRRPPRRQFARPAGATRPPGVAPARREQPFLL